MRYKGTADSGGRGRVPDTFGYVSQFEKIIQK